MGSSTGPSEFVVEMDELDSALGRMPDGSPVAFEVDQTDEVAKSGWSVIVSGHLSSVTDAEELDRLAELELHPWAPGRRDRWIKVTPTTVTGREVTRHRDFAGAE